MVYILHIVALCYLSYVDLIIFHTNAYMEITHGKFSQIFCV